jgi:hypothetical protein
MIESSRRSRFADEALPQFSRDQRLRPRHFQGDFASQLWIGGQKDHPERTVSQLAVDRETPQAL